MADLQLAADAFVVFDKEEMSVCAQAHPIAFCCLLKLNEGY